MFPSELEARYASEPEGRRSAGRTGRAMRGGEGRLALSLTERCRRLAPPRIPKGSRADGLADCHALARRPPGTERRRGGGRMAGPAVNELESWGQATARRFGKPGAW